MPQAAIIESHVAVQQVGSDVYVNEKALPAIHPNGRAVHGGLLLAQAISAASATVAPEFCAYSSYSTFLRPVTATADEKIVYHVDRIADGRSYATRVVRATQGTADVSVYIAVISFQSSQVPTGNVLDYNTPMPNLGGLQPEDIPADLYRKLLVASISPSSPLNLISSDPEPFDWRPFGLVLADQPWDYRQRSFCRSQPLSTDSPSVNMAALAHISDEILLGVAVYANAGKCGYLNQNVTMVATLSHNILFHDPTAKVDEWMVMERETSWGANGRAVIQQRMWNRKTGRLILTCTQEGVIRLKADANITSKM